MNPTLANKLNELPCSDRKKFVAQRDIILNDRVYAAKYGLTEDDYNNLPKEKIEEVENILYNELFGKKDPLKN